MHHLAVSLLLLSAAAHAEEEPQVEIAADGSVVGRILLDATPAQVSGVIPSLNDPANSSSVLDVRLVPDGECTGIFRTTRGLWSPLTMRTRLCPTAKGWREYLVESEDYDAYDVEWTVSPADAGRTEVRMVVRSEVNLAVPSAIVRGKTVVGVRESFAALVRRLFGAKAEKR
ncbi:MAG: hypothetical protein H6732_02885 [Alphaproteobacteria bacterium]|nr:hypothetical protein [Alphaproteobacteria bacterium]